MVVPFCVPSLGFRVQGTFLMPYGRIFEEPVKDQNFDNKTINP